MAHFKNMEVELIFRFGELLYRLLKGLGPLRKDEAGPKRDRPRL